MRSTVSFYPCPVQRSRRKATLLSEHSPSAFIREFIVAWGWSEVFTFLVRIVTFLRIMGKRKGKKKRKEKRLRKKKREIQVLRSTNVKFPSARLSFDRPKSWNAQSLVNKKGYHTRIMADEDYDLYGSTFNSHHPSWPKVSLCRSYTVPSW